MDKDDLLAFLWEMAVESHCRYIEWEFKTLEAVVGELSDKQRTRILKAIKKEPHLSVGEAYMDR